MNRILTKWAHLPVHNKLRLAILGALLVLIGLVNSAIQEHRRERMEDAQRQLYQHQLETDAYDQTIDDSMGMMDALIRLGEPSRQN